MKRVLSLILVIIMTASMVMGCDFLPDEIRLSTVNFYVDGELYTTKTVVTGQSVSAPKAPEKDNHIFVGWFTDGILTYEYDFSSKIIGETSLYAYFTLDAAAVVNLMTQQTLKSVVTVQNKCYNTAMGGLIETESAVAQGSGVVLDISGGYCFVLTNHHVVSAQDGYSKQTLTVEDPWGNEYEAHIYKNSSCAYSAMDESYDLALIYFKYSGSSDLSLMEIELGEDPDEDDYVISLGSPTGQKNAVTIGQVLGYRKLQSSQDDETSVAFDIIYHDALIDHGSSGGPLVDASGRLVGLNFAGYESNKHGCAIPLSKIIEFLNIYVYVNN